MHDLKEKKVYCPYCGERISVLLDPSVPHQNYIEDCQVCCRPMNIRVTVSADNRCELEATAEND